MSKPAYDPQAYPQYRPDPDTDTGTNSKLAKRQERTWARLGVLAAWAAIAMTLMACVGKAYWVTPVQIQGLQDTQAALTKKVDDTQGVNQRVEILLGRLDERMQSVQKDVDEIKRESNQSRQPLREPKQRQEEP